MPSYILTSRADGDLEEIWDYTEQTWSRTQARIYLTKLENRMIALAQHPTSGRKRYDLPGEPMSFHEGRHVIFYRPTQEGIEVLRVLHDAMDFPRHLE
jgi:toxin ParE1/3/4